MGKIWEQQFFFYRISLLRRPPSGKTPLTDISSCAQRESKIKFGGQRDRQRNKQKLL